MIGPTLRIAKLFGIPIRVDISWLLVFVLFVYVVTQNFFRPLFPGMSPMEAVFLAALTILLFFLSVLLHELAHSLVAMAHGLRVKAIVLFILGGVSQLEGEPRHPWVEFWMALAGPLASLVIGLLCGIWCLVWGGTPLARAFLRLDFLSPVPTGAAVLFWLSLENLLLFLFNIIPGFPMDGGRMVRAFLWGVSRDYSLATRVASWLGRGIGSLFLVVGLSMLLLGHWTGIWLLLVGLFLLTAARAGLNQAAVRELLQGYQVGQLMQPPPPVVPGQLALDLLVQEYDERLYSLYPVRVNDTIAGVVTRGLIHQVPRKAWQQLRVREVMAPLASEYVIEPGKPAQEAFDRMSANGAGGLLVMEGDRLLGVVTQGEMLRRARVLPALGRVRPPFPPRPPYLLPPPPAPPNPSESYERFGP